MALLCTAVLVTGRFWRFGPLRLAPYGVCAALGLVCALAFASSLAQRKGISPDRVWNAGMVTLLACVVTSRLLLVLGDPAAFLRAPLVVLLLPSLTFGAMLLAAPAVWVYLRRDKEPLLPLLDSFTPAAALFAAFLELGSWFEGSEPGMPSPWSRPGAPLSLVPVPLWGIAVSITLSLGLAFLLQRNLAPGRVAALGLISGGLAAFLLDLFSQPVFGFDGWPLEPGQCVALLAILAGGALWSWAGSARRPIDHGTVASDASEALEID